MGRLIDADELIKCLEGAVWNDAVEVVNEQPTAYDVDRTVAELEENKKTATNCSSIFDTQAYVRLDKAVEIVRKGCVKNDR